MNTPIQPLAFTSPYAWVFWAVFLLVYVPEFRLIARARPVPGQTPDRSMILIMLLGWIGFPVAFAVAAWSKFVLVRHQKMWFWLGIGLLLLGSALRRHCFKMLGSYFTANVKVADDQTVIKEGAYRWVRHPSYTGGMLMYLGTGLALTNWLSVLVIVILGGLGYAYRVRVEERALASALGQSYREYMQRTKRFVPFIF
ncbi:MAG TPA: isoprenylcysteine carboxylmethyltransferase family protein [Terriglobales bacterium]|jgi:protein-S-isoprenylcysteine O-methyltransferase Ste14|nr:isoprenylcysteine carboxylmethyltransferase family protein [Terriglobales bacterium]